MRGLSNKLVKISHLQSAIASASPKISSLSNTLSKHVQAFSQLLHVHRIAPSWGTALIEIVRRKVFLKTFISKATEMAEILAKFRMLEQKRRENFNNEISKYLPQGIIQGLDDAIPTSDIKLSTTLDNLPDITLEDIQCNFFMFKSRFRENASRNP
jgi:Lhr-like helicase